MFHPSSRKPARTGSSSIQRRLFEVPCYVLLSDRYRFLAKGFESALHLLVEEAGIDDRGEISMTQHLLHKTDLSCLPVEVRSERMPQRMRGDVLVDPHPPIGSHAVVGVPRVLCIG